MQRLVAVDALGLERLARRRRRRPLDDEAALGADRHDDRVLHHLRLHQPEDLGAEILAPVGPADAAARHLAAAQMDRLDARRVDEDLDQRARQRQLVDRAAVELEREVGLGRAVRAALEEVGAQRAPAMSVEEAPQDAVLVEVRDPVERVLDRRREPASRAPRRALAARRDRTAPRNSRTSSAAIAGLRGERLLHVGLAEGDAGLAQILAVGAQHDDLAPVEPGAAAPGG